MAWVLRPNSLLWCGFSLLKVSASAKVVLHGLTFTGQPKPRSLPWHVCPLCWILPLIGVANTYHRKSPSPEFEHLVSKPTLPMDPATCSAPTSGCREGCTALQWLMHSLPWANGVSQAARLWLRAMDGLSWHLSFSQRVNKFHHCFNFPAWNSCLIIQSFHDSSYTDNMLNLPLSWWYKQFFFLMIM